MEFQYGDWLRDEIVAGRLPAPPPNPDLAVLIELARRGGRSVLGPPPDEIFRPVPWHDLAASMTHGVDGLLDELESDTRNAVLTLARSWMTLETGEIRRKGPSRWLGRRTPTRRVGRRPRPSAQALSRRPVGAVGRRRAGYRPGRRRHGYKGPPSHRPT